MIELILIFIIIILLLMVISLSYSYNVQQKIINNYNLTELKLSIKANDEMVAYRVEIGKLNKIIKQQNFELKKLKSQNENYGKLIAKL